MLELKEIRKDYTLKDQEPVHALKGISLNFRSHEFVAILGPSGCGKTTLLNVTGGLDHYDSGDLVIKGRSTKDFSDSDWDTYRNHSIGFVFQTYNLIPHQTILKNVELALTISGVDKEERIARAKEALDQVGLKGLYKKKPNQLSGGQMQRVAIARALVNNPEIVLADEPTGALDSETSIQIMDLLKEVSKNHLVIMVTHNPELADLYASRIVSMKDGLITNDTNPFDRKEVVKREAPTKVEEPVATKGKKKHSSMSFITATGLSLSNLISKLKRTLLVAVAGSIGIIGVSTILAVSVGVNNYIYDMEDDMLSSYPISIIEEAIDMNSLLSGLSNSEKKELAKFNTSTQIGLDSMIQYMMEKYTDFTSTKTNDITEDLVAYVDDMPKNYYASIHKVYGIDTTNNIFTAFKEKKGEDKTDIISVNGLTQRYISTLMTVDGFKSYARFVDLFTNFMKELPGDKDYVLSQYDLVGHDSYYPTNDSEIALVVDENTTLTDLVLAQMGFYPQDEFLNIAEKAVHSEEAHKDYLNKKITEEEYKALLKQYDIDYPYDSVFNIDDILNHEFYYFPHNTIYQKNPTFVSHNTASVSLVGTAKYGAAAKDVKVIGDFDYVNEDDSLSGTIILLDTDDKIVLNQSLVLYRDKSTPREIDKSVFDGKWVFDNELGLPIKLELSLASSNPVTSGKTTTYELSGTGQASGLIQLKDVVITSGSAKEVTPNSPDYYYEAYLRNVDHGVDHSDYLTNPEAYGGYKVKISGILRAKKSVNFGCLTRGVYYTREFGSAFRSQANSSNIVTDFKEHIKEYNSILSLLNGVTPFHAYVHFWFDDYTDDDGSKEFVPTSTEGYANALNGSKTSNITSIFMSFLSSDSSISTDSSHLRALAGLKVDTKEEYNYKVIDAPEHISIYPNNFRTKDQVKHYLNKWNSDDDLVLTNGRKIKAATREEITVTDTISMIIFMISTLVDVISIALISFTSLSLVVSCFMIAVITYISVMERVKEIGVIRSLGGRKKDVSRLFIAENLITGFSSGVIGILFTYLLQIIINAIVIPFGITRIAALPFEYALIMIAISVLLSVISGLIPSLGASKQDPVVALRTE